MSKKQIIKNIFEEKINKKDIYEEIIRKSNEKKVKFEKFRYALIPICLLLCISIGTIDSNKKYNVNKSNGNDNIYINEMNVDIKDYSGNDYYTTSRNTAIKNGFKFEIVDKINDYSFYKDLKISNEYNAQVIYGIYVKDKAYIWDNNTSYNKEYDKFNNYLITYKVKAEGKEFKSISISFSEENKPLGNYVPNDVGVKSNINNVEIQIYKSGNIFIALFKYNDINFNIETYNVVESDFIDLIKSMIK